MVLCCSVAAYNVLYIMYLLYTLIAHCPLHHHKFFYVLYIILIMASLTTLATNYTLKVFAPEYYYIEISQAFYSIAVIT